MVLTDLIDYKTLYSHSLLCSENLGFILFQGVTELLKMLKLLIVVIILALASLFVKEENGVAILLAGWTHLKGHQVWHQLRPLLLHLDSLHVVDSVSYDFVNALGAWLARVTAL